MTVVVEDGPTVQGTVGNDRSPALSPDRVQEGLGLLEPPAGPSSVIALHLESPAPPGYEFTATVLVSKQTLLRQLLGLS